jgi:1-acyl-sn-glycerol-3-phosphate acyltransferase
VNKILYPFKVLWAYWYFFIFALIFLLLYPLFLILLSRKKWYPRANSLRVFWARVLFLLTGIIAQIQYEEPLDRNKVYVVCSNHFSYLDIPVSALAIKRNWRFVAKMELENIPILNIFFKTLDISMNRENSFRAWTIAGEGLDEHFNIVIFPEGTIAPHPPNMVRFKNGPFRLAIEKQVAILPITMLDNWKILFVDGWKMHGRPGICRAIVHSPIETKGMTLENLEELKQQVFTVIQEPLKKL